jgi:hypothetical protein
MGFREMRLETSDFVWVDVLNSITDSDADDDVYFIQNGEDTILELNANKTILEPYTSMQLLLNDVKKTSNLSRYWFQNSGKLQTYSSGSDIDSTSVSDDSSQLDFPIEEPIIRRHLEARRVAFSTSEVRVYSITIGDHPKTSCFPISLDWSYSERQVFEVENESILKHDTAEYPQGRQYNKAFRKVTRLEPQDRFDRIREVTGMSASEIERLECHRQLELKKEKQFAFFQRRKRNIMLQWRLSS